jgi:hypothetical protein
MASITITAEMFARLSETARAELMMNFGSAATAPLSAPLNAAPAAASEGQKKRGRKPKKPVDPNAPPKEKRAPNDWIIFSGRVEKLVRAGEAERGAAKEEKMRTVVVKQFASSLKKQKSMDEWTDEEIVAALAVWEPPVKTEEEVAPAAPQPVVPGVVAAEPAAEAKRRGPKKLTEMTAEERAAHDAKIAERKAKKAGESGGAAAEAE